MSIISHGRSGVGPSSRMPPARANSSANHQTNAIDVAATTDGPVALTGMKDLFVSPAANCLASAAVAAA